MADGGGFNVAIVRHFWRDSGPRSDKKNNSRHEMMIDAKKTPSYTAEQAEVVVIGILVVKDTYSGC
jgi:hypothetical protein